MFSLQILHNRNSKLVIKNFKGAAHHYLCR